MPRDPSRAALQTAERRAYMNSWGLFSGTYGNVGTICDTITNNDG